MLDLNDFQLFGVTLIFVIYFLIFHKKKGKNLPPGPWGFPIVGHILFFGKNPSITFMKWKKNYGPVIHLRFGSTPTIVLTDAKLLREAFSMEEISGRPQLDVFREMSGGKGLIFVDGPERVEQHKFALKTLKEHSFSSNAMDFRLREEMAKVINNLKSRIEEKPGEPIEMNETFQYCITNVLWAGIMGSRFDASDKSLGRLIKLITTGFDNNSSVISQLFWFFPWISRLGNFVGYNPPLKAFVTIYDCMRQKLKEMKPLHVPGQPTNFTAAYFDKIAETNDTNSSFHESKQQQPITTTDIFIGGSDTTTLTIDWLMIYMAREPHIQTQLQNEIDSVIGQSEPSVSDRPKMPFTEAVIHETLRIRSIGPLAIRRTIQDVNFQGYEIPENTMVLGNIFGIHHDPEVWEEPERFNPQRFLNANGSLNRLTNEVLSFGFGKRSCLGENFSRYQLFLLTTSFFQQFTVSCTKPPPSLDFNFGFALGPHRFKLNIVERSSQVKCML